VNFEGVFSLGLMSYKSQQASVDPQNYVSRSKFCFFGWHNTSARVDLDILSGGGCGHWIDEKQLVALIVTREVFYALHAL
jgi:hypothetical protein